PRLGNHPSAGQNRFTERRFPHHYPTDDDRRRARPRQRWTARGPIEPEDPLRCLLPLQLHRHCHWIASKNPKPSTMWCALSITSSVGRSKRKAPSATLLSYTGGALSPFVKPSTRTCLTTGTGWRSSTSPSAG